jgi:SecD/SecF fusion protein
VRALRTAVLCLIVVAATGCSAAKHERAVFQAIEATNTRDLDQAAHTMRIRLELLGVKNVSINRRGSQRLVIRTERPLSDIEKLLLTKTGSLAFYDLEGDLAGPSINTDGQPVASEDPFRLLRRAGPVHGSPSELFLIDRRGRILAGPEKSKPALLAMARLRAAVHGEAPRAGTVLAVPPHLALVSCKAKVGCLGAASEQPGKTYYYLFKRHPELTGADLKLSTIRAARGTQPGEGAAFVQMAFTSSGNRKFRNLSKTLAIRGQALANAAGEGGSSDISVTIRYAQHFAIVLDDQLESSPFIDYKQNPNGIDPTSGGAEISNVQSLPDAKELAIVLQSGALPIHFVLVH